MEKSVRLSIIGASEDMPRLIRAYGRLGTDEFSLMLRPIQSMGLFVLLQAGTGRWWRGQDCPQWPVEEVEPGRAIDEVEAFRKKLPRTGATTLRGRWTGTLTVSDGEVQVDLKRNIATYGKLYVTSSDADWVWRFERADTWFSSEEVMQSAGAFPTLKAAIAEGVEAAQEAIKCACSQRDTSRRAAYDTVYAQKYPIRSRDPKRDPTERLGRARRRRRKKAPTPPSIDEGSKIEAPSHRVLVEQQAASIQEEATRLQRLPTPTTDHSDRNEITEWFESNGLAELGRRVRSYGESVSPTSSELIRLLKRDLQAKRRSGSALDTATADQAARKIDLLAEVLDQVPEALQRTHGLIRHAEALTNSPQCKGSARVEAMRAIQHAKEAYERARTAIIHDEEQTAGEGLRQIGEQLAAIAVNLAESCARPPEAPCECAPDATSPKKRRRKRKSTTAPPRRSRKKASEPDHDKDRELMLAFGNAIAQAVKESSQ